MLVLDTDHLTEFQKGTSAEALRLRTRLAQSAEPAASPAAPQTIPQKGIRL